jgi:RNA polymerase sigma-70 factor (ECF subfamily)
LHQDQIVKCLLSERSRVLGFVRAILGGSEGTEDVFQDASLLAISKAEEIVDEAHLMAWLRVVCRNLARNVKRANSRSAIALSDEVLALLESHWSQRDGRSSDAARALSECLEKLPAKSSELVRLRYLDGLKVQEVAERVGRPAASLYVVFGRISAALANCIDRELRPQEVARG